MTFKPSRKQALLLWKMLTAESEELRSPMQSEAQPKITPAERNELVRHGFIEMVQQKRGARLALADKAWAWASSETKVELLQSNSRNGVLALEGLLHRLIPFLQRRGIALAELFTESSGEPQEAPTAIDRENETTTSNRRQSSAPPRKGTTASKRQKVSVERRKGTTASKTQDASVERDGTSASKTQDASVERQITRICVELNAQRPNRAIRLTELRSRLPGLSRDAIDTELERLQRAGRIALYRDDNSAAVTAEDTRAALFVGGEPRHLLYWKE